MPQRPSWTPREATLQGLVSEMVDDAGRGSRQPGHASNKDKTHGVIVECKSEGDATALFERLTSEGFTAKTVARSSL